MRGLAPSPAVTDFDWGRIEVEGRVFRAAKLWPGGAREWDWRETGTHRDPGIQSADVEELLERGATLVVLSRGAWRRLRVRPATLETLADAGVSVEVRPTDEALRLYNVRRESEAVAGLFHSTC